MYIVQSERSDHRYYGFVILPIIQHIKTMSDIIKKVKIKKYHSTKDFDGLMNVIISEGEEWYCYSSPENRKKYAKALESSITYVAFDDGILCGYSRSLDDNGYCIHICDLLVHRDHRGKEIGRQLMEILIDDFPDHEVYVMSDVDPYYEKLGYKNEGTIFRVNKKPQIQERKKQETNPKNQ